MDYACVRSFPVHTPASRVWGPPFFPDLPLSLSPSTSPHRTLDLSPVPLGHLLTLTSKPLPLPGALVRGVLPPACCWLHPALVLEACPQATLGDVIRARPSLSRPRPLVGSKAFHTPQVYLLGDLAHGSGLLLSTGIFDQLGVGPAFLGSADRHFL